VSYSERFLRERELLFHCTVHCTLHRRATRHVLTRAAKYIDADGGMSSCHSRPCRTLVSYQLNYRSICLSLPCRAQLIGFPSSLIFIIRRRRPLRQHPVSLVICVTVAAGTCLLSCWPEHDLTAHPTIVAQQRLCSLHYNKIYSRNDHMGWSCRCVSILVRFFYFLIDTL
jgi:hypothetical protein